VEFFKKLLLYSVLLAIFALSLFLVEIVRKQSNLDNKQNWHLYHTLASVKSNFLTSLDC